MNSHRPYYKEIFLLEKATFNVLAKFQAADNYKYEDAHLMSCEVSFGKLLQCLNFCNSIACQGTRKLFTSTNCLFRRKRRNSSCVGIG